MAGFSVDVFDHTKLDIGYRYLNQGSVPGGTGVLSSQEVRAGLRYMVDN
jgi:opacity protein-like surface antigen